MKGLRYEWFSALELPFSRNKFATPEYLARFGFLVDPQQQPTALNPANLPVGFARHADAESGEHYLDISCAACHTGELRYQGQAVRIDGALPCTRWRPPCPQCGAAALARHSA